MTTKKRKTYPVDSKPKLLWVSWVKEGGHPIETTKRRNDHCVDDDK